MYIIWGKDIKSYSFGKDHPFSSSRYILFEEALSSLEKTLSVRIVPPVLSSFSDIALFHTPNYIEFVKEKSQTGEGYLDYGDTPSFRGAYEAASYIVGSALRGIKIALEGETVFQVAGGLHHAKRDSAAGFCVFNDPGVVISYLLEREGVESVFYIDIDAHHGDGVMYGFYSDPRVIILDIHEDGRYLYPGTGFKYEIGEGKAKGTKFNVPLPPGASDDEFMDSLKVAEDIIKKFSPFILLVQAGLDGIKTDPITHLSYTIDGYSEAVNFLRYLAKTYFDNKIFLFGGGGYSAKNLRDGWIKLIKTFI